MGASAVSRLGTADRASDAGVGVETAVVSRTIKGEEDGFGSGLSALLETSEAGSGQLR
jgi:hypothetical protein